MIQIETDYLDGEITVNEEVPSTIAELTDLIGEEAVIDNVVANLYYRGKYPRVYKAVSAALVEAKFPREVKEEKTNADGTVKQILVSEMQHIRDVYKTNPDEVKSLFESIAPAAPLYVKGERGTGGGGKVSEENSKLADAVIAKGPDAVATLVSKIESVNNFKVAKDATGTPTATSLARALQAFRKFKEQEAKKAALADLV